jgi:hypothetical protein
VVAAAAGRERFLVEGRDETDAARRLLGFATLLVLKRIWARWAICVSD